MIHNYTILTILRCFYNYLYPMQGHSKSKSFMQCGGSGMFIPDPDFYPSRIRIPDLRSQISDSQNWILCYFWNAKEKNLGQFSKNCWSFYPKIFKMLSNTWVWDPGSTKAPDPGSATLPLCLYAVLRIRIWMDPHSFGWLNPDTEGQKMTNKSEEI